jgi:hypothetical protein
MPIFYSIHRCTADFVVLLISLSLGGLGSLGLAVLLPPILVASVEVLPRGLIHLLAIFEPSELIVGLLDISHDDHFLIFLDVFARNATVVDLHVAKVSCSFTRLVVVKTCEVHVIVGSLEENGRVEVEVEVEKGDVLGVTIVLQGRKGLVSDLGQYVSLEFEEHLRRSVLPFLFDFIENVINLDVDILEDSLSLETQREERVGFCLLEFVFWNGFDRVEFMQFFEILFEGEVFAWDFVEMNVRSDGIGGQLFKDVGVLAGGVYEHVRSTLENVVVESLLWLDHDLSSVEVDDFQLGL